MPVGGVTTARERESFASSAKALPAIPRTSNVPAPMRSNVRIALPLRLAAGVGDCTIDGGAHALRVLPQIARAEVVLSRLPSRAAAFHFLVVDVHGNGAGPGIDGDNVAIV